MWLIFLISCTHNFLVTGVRQVVEPGRVQLRGEWNPPLQPTPTGHIDNGSRQTRAEEDNIAGIKAYSFNCLIDHAPGQRGFPPR